MVDGILAIISDACPPSEIPEILAPKACIHFLYSFWNVNLRGADAFFGSFFTCRENINFVCSAGVFWAGDSLFMFVLLEPSSLLLSARYLNGEYRKRFAATGLVLSKRVFNKKLTLN